MKQLDAVMSPSASLWNSYLALTMIFDLDPYDHEFSSNDFSYFYSPTDRQKAVHKSSAYMSTGGLKKAERKDVLTERKQSSRNLTLCAGQYLQYSK